MGAHNIYVVSDLHLGGAAGSADATGFQMCPPEARRRLARFIAHIGKLSEEERRSDSSVELIINGDFVDFLAVQPFEAFTSSSAQAVSKLREVFATCDEGAPPGEHVFPALRKFVADGHSLTVLLGNHDLELTIPAVRNELMTYLTGGRPSRTEFFADGEACRRGRALIEHGNRYDGWNAVAHGALRAFRARASRGEPPFPFRPPAGSQLVAQVMNPLKSLYRFVDLLKPENEAVIPILAALHPSAVREIRNIYSAWRAKTAAKPGEVPEEETYIASHGSADEAVVPDSLTQIAARSPQPTWSERARTAQDPFIAELEGDGVGADTLHRTEALLAEAESLLQQLEGGHGDVVPDEYSEIGNGVLAWLRSTFSLVRMGVADDAARYQHLRNALVSHRRTIGSTFALDEEDPRYLDAANRLARSDVRFVIFGHTHMAKFIRLGNGGCYINTGTWCPTIRLAELLYTPGENDGEAVRLLQRFVKDMSMNRLGEWATLQTCFAHIVVSDTGETCAGLYEYHADGRVSRLGELRV